MKAESTNAKTFCIGHRGARGYKPENTLASFEHAVQLGCPWVELDVQAVEGELAVIHDRRVDRTTNGSGLVSDMSWAGLRSLDASGGERIPTLDDVVQLIDRRCCINVELKGPQTAGLVNQALARYCEAGWLVDEFLVSSFDHQELAQVDEQYRRGLLFASLPDDWLQICADLKGWSVNVRVKDVSPALVRKAHQAGLKVLAYTANSRADIRRVMAAGVDGIFSDYPDRVPGIKKKFHKT